MNIQDFFLKWTSTKPNLKVEFHDAGIEAMAFAEAYHKEQLRLHNVSISEAATCPKCGSKETQLIYAIYNHDCDKCGNSWEVEC